MLINKRWKEALMRIGLLFLLAAMAQDFITGIYSPALLAIGGVLLVVGLAGSLIIPSN